MATHSSFLARIIPWTEESGRLQSMGLESGTLLRKQTWGVSELEGVFQMTWANFHDF